MLRANADVHVEFLMLKTTIRALTLAAIAAGSLVPAYASVIEYGAKQEKSVIKTDKKTKSEAYWESKHNTRHLHLSCLKASLPGPNSLPECVSRAAMIVDFTKDSPRGAQVSSLSFKYQKRQAGVIFKETTDPIVRVEFLNGFATHMKTIPLRGSGWDSQGFRHVQYSRNDLSDLGLNPLEVNITRVAVIAKPKENKHVDDYANMEIRSVDYKVLNNDKLLKPTEELAIRDGSSDRLINSD